MVERNAMLAEAGTVAMDASDMPEAADGTSRERQRRLIPGQRPLVFPGSA